MLDPIVNVFARVPDNATAETLTLKEFELNVPCTSCRVTDVDKLNASCKVTLPPGESIVIGCTKLRPALVIV